MDALSQQLNSVLSDTFRSILKVEEQMLKHSQKINLTINEVHLVEAVGKNQNQGRTVSAIAEDLNITMPSVTVAINKLVKKGLVEKRKVEGDGRLVQVLLTKEGHKINMAHRYFHETMIRTLVKELTEEERSAMLKGVIKLNAFFNQKLAAEE